MANDTKPCERCQGTGEEYRPDLYPPSPYEPNREWVACIGCHGYGFEQNDAALRHCTAILAEYWKPATGETPWPVAYRADVEVHDMAALAERDASLPFVWMVRETGSILITPEECYRPADGGMWWHDAPDAIRQRDGEHRIYWWDGHKLRRTTGKDAAERLSYEIHRVMHTRRAA